MKRITSWLLASVLVWAMAPGLQSHRVFAAEVQLAQVRQPSKGKALAAAKAMGTVQPAKEEALAAVEAETSAAAPAAVGSSCTLCYSCGGNWPMFSGAIPTSFGASPYERGSSCSGALMPRSDTLPYLCCKSVP